uniref:Uncharacterized protein n=1 Tax=Myotis myotis TaxID=51298 RepID=A0A7J7ZY16_MYOMY|nr:hypothetical protein mMyoMyo1_010022 [Myotis myotis]
MSSEPGFSLRAAWLPPAIRLDPVPAARPPSPVTGELAEQVQQLSRPMRDAQAARVRGGQSYLEPGQKHALCFSGFQEAGRRCCARGHRPERWRRPQVTRSCPHRSRDVNRCPWSRQKRKKNLLEFESWSLRKERSANVDSFPPVKREPGPA